VFVLKFDLHPSLVDVNVHPRKSEVKFLDEREIFRIVTSAVQKSLEKHVLAPKIRNDQPSNYYTDREAQGLFEGKDQTIGMQAPAEIYRLDMAAAGQAMNVTNTEMAVVSATETSSPETRVLPSSFTIRPGIHEEKPSIQTTHEALQQDIYQLEFHDGENKNFEERTTQQEIVPLTQINNAYLLCTQGKSLVIVDQHAAHERVKYTEIQKFFEQKEKVIQQLLTPIQVELTHQESHILNSNKEILDGLGFEISHFGGNTFSIMAVPSLLIRHNPEKTLRGIIDDLISGELAKGDFQARIEKIITIMACRSAVKFGDPLSREEQVALIEQLQQVPLPYTCPHGRPTMIIMTDEELRERFGRKYC
jgi:DNA mismatch repair protein MutL